MTAVYDPVAHGLSVGPWRTDLPDWQVYMGTSLPPSPSRLPYSRIVASGALVASSPLRMHRHRTTVIGSGSTPTTTVTATSQATTTVMDVTWYQDALGSKNESYTNQGTLGLSLSIKNPNQISHFLPQYDFETSDPLNDLMYGDPDVVGVEVQGSYVYLWDPTDSSKETVLTEEQYLVWNPDREWAEGSGAYEADTWDGSATWSTATLGFDVSYDNTVDEPGPGGSVQKWPAYGQSEFRYDPGPWPSSDGFQYQPRDGGSIVHSGKRPNSSSAPPTPGSFSVTVTPNLQHLYAQFSNMATDYTGFAVPPPQIDIFARTPSSVLKFGYIGVATNPLPWRLIYGARITPNLTGGIDTQLTRSLRPKR